MAESSRKIKVIRVLYILSIVLFSPFWVMVIESFTMGVLSNKLFSGLIILRIYYIPDIIFLILTALYIIFLKIDKPAKREKIIFWVLLVINLIGLIFLDILFSAEMGI